MVAPSTLIQNRYRIERLLGTGGFARVYLAHDERLGRRVAVKELSALRLEDQEQQTALTLFEREARMLAQLDHPGLTNIWDFFHHDDRAYLVMEYVPGPTLRELVLNHGGPLPEPLAIACGLRLCEVLAYLHRRSPPVVFRDLKPGNVIVEDLPDQTPAAVANLDPAALSLKLIDFGIARLFKPEQSADTMIVGTPGYASPEQYGQGQTDARSDIYSLGATLHHLASGQPPNGLILPPLLQVNPNASPTLARVIARATALKPEDRYQSIDLLRRDLLAISESVAHAAPAPALSPRVTVPLAPPPRIPTPPVGTSPLIMAVIALVILGLVGVGAFTVRAIGRSSPEASPQVPQSTAANVPTSASVAPVAAALPGATGRLIYGQYTADVFSCDIYLTDIVSQATRRIVGDANNTAAVLSPDGEQIATTKNGVVYLGPLDNPTQRQVSTTGIPARYPAFSPDGNSLAFSDTPNNNGVYRLVIVDLGTGQARYPGPSRLGWLTWSQRGLTYAAPPQPGQPQDIFILDENGTPRNLTNTPDTEEEFPAWSPNGQELLFTASTPGDLNTRQIFRTNAEGSERSQLTTTPGPHTNAAFSPDGEWIAYVSRATGGRFQLWAMRADGSKPRRLTDGDEGQFYVTWAE